MSPGLPKPDKSVRPTSHAPLGTFNGLLIPFTAPPCPKVKSLHRGRSPQSRTLPRLRLPHRPLEPEVEIISEDLLAGRFPRKYRMPFSCDFSRAAGKPRICEFMPTSEAIPNDNLDFAWDRPETGESLRMKLALPDSPDRIRTVAWLMREARVNEVWQFLSLREVASLYPQVRSMLGRREPLWDYLLRTAHELGRL